jgi:hypothetical protein
VNSLLEENHNFVEGKTLNGTDAPIQVPGIFFFILLLVLKFLNLLFQMCLLFVPEMSASIMSYNVQIIYMALAWILYPLHFSLLPLI